MDGSSADGFPEDDIGVAWIGDLEAIDLYVLEGRDLLEGRTENLRMWKIKGSARKRPDGRDERRKTQTPNEERTRS
jgi:hypothetical protein